MDYWESAAQELLKENRTGGYVRHVRDRDGDICQCCGLKTPQIEVHHIHPLFLGGRDHVRNMICLCHECHRFAPGNPEEFLSYQRTGGAGWLLWFGGAIYEAATTTPEMTISEFMAQSVDARLLRFEQSYSSLERQTVRKSKLDEILRSCWLFLSENNTEWFAIREVEKNLIERGVDICHQGKDRGKVYSRLEKLMNWGYCTRSTQSRRFPPNNQRKQVVVYKAVQESLRR